MANRNNRRIDVGRGSSSSRKDATDLPKRPLAQEPSAKSSSADQTSTSSRGSRDPKLVFDTTHRVKTLNLASPRKAAKSPKFPYKSQSLNDDFEFGSLEPPVFEDSLDRGANRFADRHIGADRGSNDRRSVRAKDDSAPFEYRSEGYQATVNRSRYADDGRFSFDRDVSYEGRYSSTRRSSSYNAATSGASMPNAATSGASMPNASSPRTTSRYTVSASELDSTSKRHDPSSFYANMFEEDPNAVYAGGKVQNGDKGRSVSPFSGSRSGRSGSPFSGSRSGRSASPFSGSRSSRSTSSFSGAQVGSSYQSSVYSAAPYSAGHQSGGAAAAIKSGAGSFFRGAGHLVSALWRRSKAVVVIAAIVLIAAGAFMVDGIATSNRIHNGIHVGEIDVSGLTVEEAAARIDDVYGKNLYATSVYIFADEETASSADIDMHMIEAESLAEQLSFEEAQALKKLWITSASDLNAQIPSKDIAERAFAIGREEGGLFARLGAQLQGVNMDVHAIFDETLLSNLISDINSTLGSEVREYGVEIENGKAMVTAGNDGYILNSDNFTNAINDALLADEDSIKGFVADIEYTKYRINEKGASEASEAINTIIPKYVDLEWEGQNYRFDRNEVMSWVSTRIVEAPAGSDNSGRGMWALEPYLDSEKGVADIINEIIDKDYGEFSYTLEKSNDEVYLKPTSGVELPVIDEAMASLDESLFGDYRKRLENPSEANVGTIEIESRISADKMTIDEAISFGLVKEFSSYTTMYTNTRSTANRTYNVHLAAEKIGESIIPSDGKWSFNEVAGSCDEAAGFTEANVINSGEYTQAFGGGICQVATTVFNAVYNAGLKINERHNHTLYSSSYPAGLDAAIAYPDWDLAWTNTTGNDMLLRTSYTDTSITVKLIGRDPSRTVTTITGDWVDGAKHTTKYEEDSTLAANASYVKTAGTDGMQIAVSRIVKDSDGNVLYEDNFYSSYAPIQRVIVFGTGSDMAALRAKYAEDKTKGQ